MRRNEEIDRLRALAIVATVYAHIPDLWMWRVPFKETMRKFSAGYDGVLLFFTISGFVISASLIPKLEKAVSEKESLSNVLLAFFCKRLFRITPTATLWIALTFLAAIIIDPASVKGNVYAAIAALTNFFNVYVVSGYALPNAYGVYWSLSLEEQFYVALPIVFLLFKTTNGRLLTLLLIVAVTEFSGLQWIKGVFQIPPIVGGVSLYLIDRKYGLLEKLRSSKFLSRGVLILLAALLSVSIFVIPLIRPFTPHYLLIMGLVCTCLVCIAVLGKGSVLVIPGTERILYWLGSRSFTLYLTHLPMIYMVRYCWVVVGPHMGQNYSADNNFAIFATWIVLTVLVTEFSYRFFEMPLLEKGRGIAGRIELIGNTKSVIGPVASSAL
ncbi:acyltransferase family protein [Pseudomonas antarctica]|uniref:acyltransferase family protein n=1 Tax=Pseudomonas antarctica TaxID=219572 RepID=UPI00387B52ED